MSKKLDDYLSLVSTVQKTYLGYMQSSERELHISKAATIDANATDPKSLAYQYFVQAAKKDLEERTIPMNAVESVSPQIEATTIYKSYEELSRVAARGQYGKVKIRRLEKLLGGE